MVDPSKDITATNSIVGDDDSGTGVYWLNDAKGTQERVFVPDITLARAKQLADQLDTLQSGDLESFRWIPEKEHSFISLTQSKCGGQCVSNFDCVNPACRCIDGICSAKRT
jgi:hypothetical protein